MDLFFRRLVSMGAFPLLLAATAVATADPLPPDATYRPLPTVPFDTVKTTDEAAKPAVMARQRALLNQRYDLRNRPMTGVMMSGGRKAVQGGVRVKLPSGKPGTVLPTCQPPKFAPRACCRRDSCPCRM